MTETAEKIRQEQILGASPYTFRRLIDQDIIAEAVQEIASRLRADYAGKNPVFVGVLNGCFMFMADLVRAVNIPCEVDFIRVSSYANAMESGEITLVKDIEATIAGRDVILVEDIVDTGKSLDFLRNHLRAKQPRSLVMAAMFIKGIEKSNGVTAEYVGMQIPDQFVIGYGLDFAQQWRHLADLWVRIEE